MENTLNDDQLKGVEFLKRWWVSREMIAVIDGEAGTGKTFMLAKAIEQLPAAVPLFTAPTNEAVRQLELALPFADSDFVMTTFSAVGYYMDTASQEKKFKVNKNANILQFVNLIIVDEYSMVSIELLRELITYSKQKKILFIGDRDQLPSVVIDLKATEVAESPVTLMDYPTFHLRKVERSGGDLLDYVRHLRSLIHAKVKLYKKSKWVTSKDDLYDYIHEKEGRQKFKSGEAKIVGYTNDEVDGWNYIIRESLHRGKKLDTFMYKDMILLTEPTVDHSVLKMNRAGNFKKDSVKVLGANSRYQVNKIDQKTLFGIQCFALKTFEGPILYVPENWQDVVEFKNKTVGEIYKLESFKKRMDAFRKMHSQLDMFARTKYSYAFTTHRSQGMTIPEVYVNLADINKCQNVMLRHKLLYVAASRAREKMFLVQ